MNTFCPSEHSLPMRAPPQMCTQCQIRVPSPIWAPASMIAVGSAVYPTLDQLAHCVMLAFELRQRRVADLVYGLNRFTRDIESEAATRKDLAIAVGVKIAEAV